MQHKYKRKEDKENYLVLRGKVTAARGNGNFLVKVEDFEEPISCTLSGKIRINNIRVCEGDFVTVEVSGYDSSKGRITKRG